MINEPDSDGLGSCIEKSKQRFRSAFTKKNLYKRLPILRWLPRYDLDDAIGDLVAGITVGLTVIPQSLAYSSVAGLDAKVRQMKLRKIILIIFSLFPLLFLNDIKQRISFFFHFLQ